MQNLKTFICGKVYDPVYYCYFYYDDDEDEQ